MSCLLLGDLKDPPSGPEGTDIESCPIMTDAGAFDLKIGATLTREGTARILRKIRRCENGETYGMVEFPDGALLWACLAPAPVPPLSKWQEVQIAEARNKIPFQFLVKGDARRQVGDRVSNGDKKGRIVLMVSSHSMIETGTIEAMDDGSLSYTDLAMAMVDGRFDFDRATARRMA